MEKRTWKITLADGSVIENLDLNGNNFISRTKLTASDFTGKLSTVVIDNGERTETHKNMDLVQIMKVGKEYWFILRDITEAELRDLKFQSQLDYIAMITDVDLEEA